MRFFADTASWNRPIVGSLGGYPDYPARLIDNGGGTAPGAPGTFIVDYRNYSLPMYGRQSATTTAKLFQASWAMAQQTLGTLSIGASIPWNPAWQPAPGNDRMLCIVDEVSGEWWELWSVGEPAYNCVNWPNVVAGMLNPFGAKVYLAGANYGRDLWSFAGDAKVGGRGCGMRKLALTVRASEVLAGHIAHALPLTVSNPMFGPMASPPIGNSAPGAGISSGFYLPPATRLEHANPATLGLGAVTTAAATDDLRARSVPSGMRFGLRITDAEINAWLDRRAYTGTLRQTARIFAVAFRDFGAIVAETQGMNTGGVTIETDGMVDPVSRYEWAQAGVVDDGTAYPARHLLDGLVTVDRLYVAAA